MCAARAYITRERFQISRRVSGYVYPRQDLTEGNGSLIVLLNARVS